MAHDRFSPPASTYRVQLNRQFRFQDARAIVPYLAALGVSACYTSPHFKANPGSTHGYDISDHGALNPELGTLQDYEAFSQALAAHALGHVADIVPNHMTADPMSNRWWREVLENGPSSPYSAFFDVDWDPIKPELKNKVLLPVLGDQYGRVLERGELQLRYEAGTVVVLYGGVNLPLNPRQLPRVLAHGLEALERDDPPDVREYRSIMTALSNLPAYVERDPDRVAERHREAAVARDRLARLVERSPWVAGHIETCLTRANGTPGDASSFDALHDLLERQAYRLAYWRTAFDEINYRRFFDVNGLVALRMESPQVFEATHALLATLIGAGHITGLRVDHPDGLFDPKAYFDALQTLARSSRPAGAAGDFYVIAEKILTGDEELEQDWPVAGTTGYEFLNLLTGLFVDGRHAAALRRVYARLTGQQALFGEVAYQCKRVITLTSMASELNVLAHDLNRLSEADRRHRDFTLDSCRKALREVLACFPVYRSYVSARGVSARDRTVIETALSEARRRNPVMEESIFDFLRQVLLPDDTKDIDDQLRRSRLRFTMKLQQFASPVQAKGVEDTAFYRYHALVAANDVGGHPGRLGVPAAEFHHANTRRLARWPTSLMASTTHDTKRGEDARLRLAALSELPDDWRRHVSAWMRVNGRNRTRIGTQWAPDRNDEYHWYQALAGAWPAEPADAPLPVRAPADLVERLEAYVQKAVREAKVHTSWIDKDQRYGRAVAAFVRQSLTGTTAPRFLASFVPLARRLARIGAINSLAALVLKLAAPGVVDFYQGSELWDLSLVDPDNRREVDFAHRQRLLESLAPQVTRIEDGQPDDAAWSALLDGWPDGRIKMLTTHLGLRLRQRVPDLFLRGEYVPLTATGPASDHIVALARRHRVGTLVAVVPRLVARFVGEASIGLPAEMWQGTRLPLPDDLRTRCYRDVLTGARVHPPDAGVEASLAIDQLFRTLPVALLWSSAAEGA
jgi:(1->4)-alpha-D-glucan 1-alpha-D-glucosylmutase